MPCADQLNDFSVYSCANGGTESSCISSLTTPSLFEFINRFSGNGGFNPDEITEFVADIDAISGISVEVTPSELSFSFTVDTGASQAFLVMSIQNNRADIYSSPWTVKDFLPRNGHFPVEADDFYDFFRGYIDDSRCKLPPYEYVGNYYARVPDLLQHAQELIYAIKQFLEVLA